MVRSDAFTAGEPGSNPGQGIKISSAVSVAKDRKSNNKNKKEIKESLWLLSGDSQDWEWRHKSRGWGTTEASALTEAKGGSLD